MTFSVYQHWDPLKVCAVGQSYPPEIYDYIKNDRVRKVFYKIAEETEEDYQKLITLLKSFNVEVLRPNIEPQLERVRQEIIDGREIESPGNLMQPRDLSIMLGSDLYWRKSPEWNHVIEYCENNGVTSKGILLGTSTINPYSGFERRINAAMTTRLGKDLYIGTLDDADEDPSKFEHLSSLFPDYRVRMVVTKGHTDGSFTPVVPGLIVSIVGEYNYTETFPGWEVVYLPGESWQKMGPFLILKQRNNGKWWVPGEELNEDFTRFVERWMSQWVGYAEESVFDVNMLVIDKKNVIVNGYNRKVFDAFSRYGITPHICNFRHRYFWDGGLHCVTSDLHREGVKEDYFPERG